MKATQTEATNVYHHEKKKFNDLPVESQHVHVPVLLPEL